MCGRFSLYASNSEIQTELGVGLDRSPPPRYNIAPGQSVLVVRLAGGTPECVPVRWGLVPSWTRDATAGSRLINARSETAAQKPSFREAFRQRRCLVPASGFFEWTDRPARRPYYFSRADGRLCVFAGLWETWRGPDGADLASCAILTTTANAIVAEVHERMPVILERERFALWLDGSPAAAQALLAPAPPGLLTRRAVGPAVNDALREGAACVACLCEQDAAPQRSFPGI
jgi:putative SOS response-associated peptidase YedK